MLRRLPYPEIVVGLVAPVGVDLVPIKSDLKHEFEQKGYGVFVVKVTEMFPVLHRRLHGQATLLTGTYHDRVRSYIAFGNELRDRFGSDDILAASAIFEIARTRRDQFKQRGAAGETYERKIFLVDQLKRPEEVELLRSVYGPLFFQMSVYARRETRTKFIASRIARDLAVSPGRTAESMALELVATDENEASLKHGQRVGRTFHGADFIINTEARNNPVAAQIHRFSELLFGSNKLSPTKSEYGMYAAKVAALRTLDLSRQVGAAIFTEGGEVIALGSNEVPKGSGGTYWSDEQGLDAREYTMEGDTNDEHKKTVAREFFKLAMEYAEAAGDFDEFAGLEKVKDSRAMDALEYGRIVHAEMSALMDAARRGTAVKDGVLFTTTFPCHLCAKHIVAAGLSRVVYLEPYPKSLVSDLHLDSISVDGADRGRYTGYPSVAFEHFYGVTPRRYREFFERTKRKSADGKFLSYVAQPPQPIVAVYRPTYAKLEQVVIQEGLSKFDSLQIKARERRDLSTRSSA